MLQLVLTSVGQLYRKIWLSIHIVAGYVFIHFQIFKKLLDIQLYMQSLDAFVCVTFICNCIRSLCFKQIDIRPTRVLKMSGMHFIWGVCHLGFTKNPSQSSFGTLVCTFAHLHLLFFVSQVNLGLCFKLLTTLGASYILGFELFCNDRSSSFYF